MTALSLGEVEALALKAARGAGLDWGLAEEAAFATRWLVELGIDGLALLAAHLGGLAAEPKATLAVSARQWHSPDALTLCPIVLGAALSDHFDLPEGAAFGVTQATDVAYPTLVLPFLANAGARSGVIVTVEWGETQVLLSDGSLLALAGAEGLLATCAPDIRVTAKPKWLAATGNQRPAVSASTVDTLNRLAFRTYVPASDQSRRDAGTVETDSQ